MKKKPIIVFIFILLIGFISSFSIFGLTGYEYLTNSTVAYWDMETGIGTYINSSTGKYGLTMYGGTTWSNGKIGKGYYATSTGGYDQSCNSTGWGHDTFDNGYSYSIWSNSSNKNNGFLINTNYFSIRTIYTSGSNIKYSVTDYDGTNEPTVQSADVPYGVYHHILVNYNGSSDKLQLWVNGVKTESSLSLSSIATTSRGHCLGNWENQPYEYIGQLDEVAIFNRTLNVNEIMFLYSNGTPTNLQRYPFTDFSTMDIFFINQTPSVITNTNLFNYLNLTINYNITLPNIEYSYINYTINSSNNLISQIINGSVTKNGYLLKNSTFNTTQIFKYEIDADNGIYPSVNLFDEEVFENTVHINYNISNSNQYMKVQLYNFSLNKSNNYLEVMLNSTGNTRLIYCNSTYTNGNPLVNSNCNHFLTIPTTNTYNHSHSDNSKHNLYVFPINNTGFINGVKVTENGYFIFNSQTGITNLYYISNTTRTDTFSISTNSGSSYTNIVGTPDLHLHQFGTNDLFQYSICALNSTNTNCSNQIIQNIGLSAFPPTSPEIIYPDNESLNITERYLNITWTASFLIGASNVNYTVQLLNLDDTVNKTIVNTNLTSYNYDLINNNITIGYYKIKINATDNNNLSSYDIGEQFYIVYDAILNITAKYYFDNSTITGFNLTILDLNNSEYRILTTFLNYLNFSIIKGHNYNITIDNSEYSFDTKNLIFNNSFNNYTYYLNKTNSVYFLIYDAGTLRLINTSSTLIELSSLNNTFSYTTNNGTYLAINITPDIYTVKFNNSGYSTVSYILTINPDTSQQLKAYMTDINSTELIFFYIQNLASEPLNATVNIQQLINSSYVTIGNKITDLTGFTYFYLVEKQTYRITISSNNYKTKTFDFEPFLVNSPYLIKLDPSSISQFTSIFTEVDYTTTPTTKNLSVGTNTFSIQTNSPNGLMLFTYINCNGNISNVTGSPNGATAQVQLTYSNSKTITCQYILSATGFNPVTFYKTYIVEAINPDTITNLGQSMENIKNSLGDKGSAWTTILAFFIIIGISATILSISGNTLATTFVVFAGIAGFAILGWIDRTIAFFTVGIVILTYYLINRGT